jgi:hypothetical protein
MNRPLPRRLPRISLPWLLWLAMLLPLAQTAAAWHEMSHAAARVADQEGDQKAVHAAACGLCLASAAVHGTGMAPAAPVVPHPALSQWHRARTGVAGVSTSPALGYLSRAPPVFSR